MIGLDFQVLLYLFGGVAAMATLAGLIIVRLSSSPPDLSRHETEKYFSDPSKPGSKLPFPSIHDKPTLDLSVIVPSYNEEERLPGMLKETTDFLEDRQKKQPNFTYEVIVVDDGSKDKTTQAGLEYSKKLGVEKVRVLTFHHNRGKGGAIRLGLFSARGKQLLFADADAATRFSDLEKLEKLFKEINKESHGMAIVCGSRAHLQDEAVASRSLFRTFLMHGFHFLVWFLCVRGIRDTQCGFKLLTREAAIRVFSNLHVERWAFDVEMLYIAQCLGVPIGEVAVNWTEIDGSKMVPVFSWLQMGKDILLIRLRYMLGGWRINYKVKAQ
ncbi:ALG5 [Branchiostoma lanceolatum]|uniref:Dolichyl-phosphate beta-glucosyltransferase n=1 Tax=Branchiostoma lanceolatum TaxID=7740 RepID=A0A8K0ETG5_BRALA|nr:ALG5 [Branchiostoma lanceolatum]